ncbi:MAG: type IV pilus assembly protein PilM, partial [Endomicrobiia bacterium]
GSYSVKIIQLKNNKGRWFLSKYGIVDLPEDIVFQETNPVEKRAIISSLIKNCLSQNNITTKNAATSVSGSSVIVRYVKLPKISKEDLAKSIQFEAEPYIPFDIKEVNLGFYILGEVTEEGQKKTDTVLVAAKKETVQAKMDILQDAGLRSLIIDVDAFALESSYEINRDAEIQETVVMVNIGANVTNITILENGVSRVVRDIFIGGNTFTKTIQKNLQCDFKTAETLKKKTGLLVTPEEKEQALKENNKDAIQCSNFMMPVVRDLLNEVHRSIDFFYAQRGEQQLVNRIILSGGGAKLLNIDKYFSQEMKLPTEIFDPLKKIERPSNFSLSQPCELAVSVGLATRNPKEK